MFDYILRNRHESNQGTVVLAAERTKVARWPRHYVFEDGEVARLLRDGLTYHDVQANLCPYAPYLFIAGGIGCSGIRSIARGLWRIRPLT
jgi:hypothetical protein